MTKCPFTIIVLVNWNTLKDTLECLESLSQIEYPNWRVVLVDNGSKAGEVDAIRNAFPAADIIETGQNLGFTGGNNVGIQCALEKGADYILCLNNDTTVAPDFLSLLVEGLEANPESGIVTSAIYSYSQPTRISALGCWVRLDSFPTVGHITATPDTSANKTGVVEIPFAEGCVLMMRRVVAEQTGGFNDAFFAYLEDADLTLRANRFGWKSILVPDAKVWHKIDGKEGGQGTLRSIMYGTRNSWFVVKHHGTKTEKRRFYLLSILSLIGSWKGYAKTCIVNPNGELYFNHLYALNFGAICGLLGRTGQMQQSTVEGKITHLLNFAGVMVRRIVRPAHSVYKLYRKVKMAKLQYH